MNKTMIAAIAIGIVLVAAVVVMSWDATQDGGDETIPTDGNDETFQHPLVDDPATGSVVTTGIDSWDSVTFTAVPEDGYTFDRWVNTGDRSLYSHDVSITVDIGDVPALTAIFKPLEGNKVVDFHWSMPSFDGDSCVPTAWSDQQFSMVISSVEWGESRYDDSVQRSADGEINVPWNMVRDDVAVQAIVEYLEPMVASLNDVQKATVILAFVQEVIDYRTDSSQYGVSEFWAFPMETVYSGEGDCEDTSTLFVSIASVMGLNAGFVSFEDPVMGHMGAAINIGESQVPGAAVFEFDGSRYAFVETTIDGSQQAVIGYLSTVYDILDGKWTPVTYVEESGEFLGGQTFFIADGTEPELQYGEPVWGSDVSFGASVSQPPTIPLNVGDTFTYTPTTSLPSEIFAYGSGIVGTYGGSFLTWDPETNTLYGTATQPGFYTVTLEATWTQGNLQQTAYQVIEFEVSSAHAGGVTEDKELVYASGEWSIESIVTDPVEPEEEIPVMWIVAGALAVVIVVAVIVRTVA